MSEQTNIGKRLSRRHFIVTAIGLTGGLAMMQACTPAAPTTPSKPAEPAKPAEAAKPAEIAKPGVPSVASPQAAASPQAGASPAAKPAAQAAPAVAKVMGVFTFATDQQTQTLDPIYINREAARAMSQLMHETLVTLDNPADPKIVPGLAKSWSTSSDGTTWTFKLQENVKFHDGTPMNAEAVKFSIDRLKDPKSAATSGIARVQILDRVDVVDNLTVNFVTKAPYSEFLLALVDPGTAVVSPTAVQKTANQADFGKAPVGTGPYKFGEWQGTDASVVVPNADYWGPNKAKLERIILKGIPETGAIVAGLEAGEIDYTNSIPPALFARVQQNNRLKVSAVSTTATHIMGVLTVKKPFDDVRVRQALMHAVDRDTICKTIMRGLAVPQTSPLWPGNQFRVEQTPYNFDQAKSKQLLNEAGYGSGFSCAILFSSFSPSAELCQAYGEYLSQVGITVDLQQRDDAVWSQLVRAKDNARDLFLQAKSGIGTDFNLNRLYSSQLFDEDNRGRWTDPRVEELLPKGRQSFDDAEKAKIYTEIQKIVWDNVPELFGWHPQTILAMSNKVEGLVFHPWPMTFLHGVSKTS